MWKHEKISTHGRTIFHRVTESKCEKGKKKTAPIQNNCHDIPRLLVYRFNSQTYILSIRPLENASARRGGEGTAGLGSRGRATWRGGGGRDLPAERGGRWKESSSRASRAGEREHVEKKKKKKKERLHRTENPVTHDTQTRARKGHARYLSI